MPLHLVETSDEDSFISVAHHLADLLNEGQVQRYDEYVSRMASHVGTLFGKLPEKEAECCVSVMVHAVGRTPEEQQQAAATTLAEALAQGDEGCESRLAGLFSLYGILTRPAAQLVVLHAAARFAARNSAKCRAAFSTAVRGKSSKWVAEWKLGADEARKLYLALAAAMRGASDRPTTREHLSLVGQALVLPGPQDEATAEAAGSAVADYLRSASIFTLDLLSLPPVAALASHAKYGPVHKLATAVLAGDVAATRAAATPAALEAAGGLTSDAALAKVRMTALLAACATAAGGGGEVALSELRAALDVPEGEILSWIVRAIGAKLIEGRIDAVRGVLAVARSTHPSFGPDQWAKLGAQLKALQVTLGAATEAMAGVKPPTHVSGPRAAAATVAATAALRA